MPTSNLKVHLLLLAAAGGLIGCAAKVDQPQDSSACMFYGRVYKHATTSEPIDRIGVLSRVFPISATGGDWERALTRVKNEWLNFVSALVGNDVDGNGACLHFPTPQEASEWIDRETTKFRDQDARVVSTEFEAHSTPAAAQDDCDGIPPPCTIPGWLPQDGRGGLASVQTTAQNLYMTRRYGDLDALINRYSKLQDRLTDGKFKLAGISEFLDDASDTQGNPDVMADLRRWRTSNPKSIGATLLEISYWRNAAWKARGDGLANTVSPEGWRLFHERLQLAQEALIASEAYAAANPLWYMEYLEVDLGLGVPRKEEFAVYQQGIHAFPDFFPLHFAMIRALRPEWGGSHEAIASFIEIVVNRSPEAVQAEMYTRLWWYADGFTSPEEDLFGGLGASWPQMKRGFDALLKHYPASVWNKTNYASFACRAGDMTTFTRLRTELGIKIDARAFRSNMSLDVCAARAAGKPI